MWPVLNACLNKNVAITEIAENFNKSINRAAKVADYCPSCLGFRHAYQRYTSTNNAIVKILFRSKVSLQPEHLHEIEVAGTLQLARYSI
jgi:hypothetical protein